MSTPDMTDLDWVNAPDWPDAQRLVESLSTVRLTERIRGTGIVGAAARLELARRVANSV